MAEKVVKKCDVEGCDEDSVRSISTGRVKGALEWNLSDDGKRAHLCKRHYREFKKATKKDRELDRLAW